MILLVTSAVFLYNVLTSSLISMVMKAYARIKAGITMLMKGAPLYEQKEACNAGKRRRRVLRMARVN